MVFGEVMNGRHGLAVVDVLEAAGRAMKIDGATI